jgi:hypothetical protein
MKEQSKRLSVAFIAEPVDVAYDPVHSFGMSFRQELTRLSSTGSFEMSQKNLHVSIRLLFGQPYRIDGSCSNAYFRLHLAIIMC